MHWQISHYAPFCNRNGHIFVTDWCIVCDTWVRSESVDVPISDFPLTLRWRRNGRDSVSNHQPHSCLLNRLFRRRSKKTSKLRVTGLCVGNSPGPENSPHKGPVTRKMFPFDDVIMQSVSPCCYSPNIKTVLSCSYEGLRLRHCTLNLHIALTFDKSAVKFQSDWKIPEINFVHPHFAWSGDENVVNE